MMRQTGVALITVLVVVAIISGIASSVIFEQQFAIRRTENLQRECRKRSSGGELVEGDSRRGHRGWQCLGEN